MHNHEQVNGAQLPRAETIARLNDKLRQNGEAGIVLVTRGVMELADFDAAALANAIQGYKSFDRDNDPHGERDFGDLAMFGAELLWKIDYFDRDLMYESDDPANGKITRRVLTVMLAFEY
jgi:hypothetical protein